MAFKLIVLSALLTVAYAAPQLGLSGLGGLGGYGGGLQGGLGEGLGGLGGHNQYSHHVPVLVQHKKIQLISHHEEEPYDHHPAYKFHYGVADKKHGDYHGQTEHRDGDRVEGEYWLVEPDGHKRTVRYHVDKKSGFIAHVQREELVKHHAIQNNLGYY